MGKIKKGILGGFSGRVGNVIGGSWKGIDYMRSEATSIADPKTAKQLEQRSKFRVAVEFAKQVVPIINIGLKQYATKRSEFNYLVSRICKDWWDDANDNINYPLVQLSAGELPTETIRDVTIGDDVIAVSFTCDNVSYGENVAICCAYSPTLCSWCFSDSSNVMVREDEAVSLRLIPDFGADDFYVYLFFLDESTGSCSPTAFYHKAF